MEKLRIKLENCHGVRHLEKTLEFKPAKHGDRRFAVAIYAPNGAMKTSFARTFGDLAQGRETTDHMFPDRVSVREIADEDGQLLDDADVVVILSYDEEFGPTESTSTLLVNASLRREFESLQRGLDVVRNELVTAIKQQAGTKADVAVAISQRFTTREDKFFPALARIREELDRQEDAPFADVPYDVIFNDRVMALLKRSDITSLLEDYVSRLNKLLDESKYFARDTFTYLNGTSVAKSLATNGFFAAGHSVLLRDGDGEAIEFDGVGGLEELIEGERKQIASDAELRKQFWAIEAAITKNADVRKLKDFLEENPDVLRELADIASFEEKLWKSYLKRHEELYRRAIETYWTSADRMQEIERQAKEESTDWERVINEFNARFYVPFKLSASNRDAVVLGQETVPRLEFEFLDGADSAPVERADLLQVLSNGEKKALYILNVLFEVETRKKTGRTTVFVIDDLADSFDYRNKYAIIQYLREMTTEPNFRLILLTHNFDFFRTLQGRGVASYGTCLMAEKGADSVTLEKAEYIQNPFANDFKLHFYDDAMKRVACIPFVRNILEYTKGEDHPDYIKLTSLLHWKSDSVGISQADLDRIFKEVFGGLGAWHNPTQPVVELIEAQARDALGAPQGINLDNKIVLSIATRLAAERHMSAKIADQAFVDGIERQQTYALFTRYKTRGLGDAAAIAVLDSVVLMTPEHIHVNSFMYEPIIDMSDEHLRQLFRDTSTLLGDAPNEASTLF